MKFSNALKLFRTSKTFLGWCCGEKNYRTWEKDSISSQPIARTPAPTTSAMSRPASVVRATENINLPPETQRGLNLLPGGCEDSRVATTRLQKGIVGRILWEPHPKSSVAPSPTISLVCSFCCTKCLPAAGSSPIVRLSGIATIAQPSSGQSLRHNIDIAGVVPPACISASSSASN